MEDLVRKRFESNSDYLRVKLQIFFVSVYQHFKIGNKEAETPDDPTKILLNVGAKYSDVVLNTIYSQ